VNKSKIIESISTFDWENYGMDEVPGYDTEWVKDLAERIMEGQK
jgi:hypothetical protein